jgi:UDP-N-acetylglucosamine:LPS N-acetylglucosamine transferase
LIPLPGATEQYQNALVLADAGSAEILEQNDLTPESLAKRVCELLRDCERLQAMRARGRIVDPGLPARLLVDEIIVLAREGGYPSAS